MMKFLFAILMVSLFIIVLTDEVNALKINEIESNPQGDDSGNEWVELYSEDSVSLENHYLENGDGEIYNLSGSFSGYFIITFSKLWLDNTNETVYLKDNIQVIDEVGPFNDNKNNPQTYSYCNGEWKFDIGTKNQENSCDSPQIINQNSNQEEEIEIEELEEKVEDKNKSIFMPQEIKSQKQKPIKISLSKEEPIQEITKTYKTRIGVIYFFIGFCVFIVVLIALKKL